MDNKNIIEFDEVYLEFKPEFVPKEQDEENEVIYKTAKLSKKEILERLERTQSLHL